jgi:hypothetical protein
MALQLPPGQQPVEHAEKLGQSIKINTYLCQPLSLFTPGDRQKLLAVKY